jgi:hypothetical protein
MTNPKDCPTCGSAKDETYTYCSDSFHKDCLVSDEAVADGVSALQYAFEVDADDETTVREVYRAMHRAALHTLSVGGSDG